MQTRSRQITAREIIDWQTDLLRFWNSATGITYSDTFLIDEAQKWGTIRELEGQSGLLAHFSKLPLINGSPYYVTAEIQDIILGTAKLRDSMKYSLFEHQLITPAGFLVFERQFYLKDGRGQNCGIRAMTWRSATVSLDPQVGGMLDLTQHATGRGVEISFYSDVHDPRFFQEDDTFVEFGEDPEQVKRLRRVTKFLLLAHKGLPFGEFDFYKVPEMCDDADAIMMERTIKPSPEFMKRMYGRDLRMTADMANRLKREEGMFFPHDLFVATIMVMNQKVAGIAGVHTDRAAYKRATREGITAPNLVNIVTLRKLLDRGKFFPDEWEENDVNWSHRWWVNGHWRRQYYPSRDEHEWIYIEPHIKGPEHLPLLEKPDVYFLER